MRELVTKALASKPELSRRTMVDIDPVSVL